MRFEVEIDYEIDEEDLDELYENVDFARGENITNTQWEWFGIDSWTLFRMPCTSHTPKEASITQ